MAGGANIRRRVTRKRLTGVRPPMMTAHISNQQERRLLPWGGHAVRPGEIILNADLMGDSMFRRIMHLESHPLTYAEMGVWLIPLSTLGTAFTDIVVDTAQDTLGQAGKVIGGSTAADFRANNVTDEGHLTPGLQSKNRPWAGEVGDSDDTVSENAFYAPFVSFGTWLIGESYYRLDWDGIVRDRDDPDLLDAPPLLDPYVAGASISSIPQSTAPDVVPAADSLAARMERMNVLGRTERSYAEYLAANGTHPSRAAGMPRPVMVEQRVLTSMGSPQIASTGFFDFTPETEVTGTAANQTFGTQNDNLSNSHRMFFDGSPIGTVGTKWRRRRFRPVRVWEPSIVLGTIVWWPIPTRDNDFSHIMDVNKLVSAGNWGDSSLGEPDLSDFVGVYEARTKDGSALQGDRNGGSGVRVANFLNHYMHGDHFTYNGDLGTSPNEWEYRTIGGDTHSSANIRVNTRLNCRLQIATDLVG